jgi:hypothetical protein
LAEIPSHSGLRATLEQEQQKRVRNSIWVTCHQMDYPALEGFAVIKVVRGDGEFGSGGEQPGTCFQHLNGRVG